MVAVLMLAVYCMAATMAGGLNPENVTAAIKAVRPWGVDSCTGTDLRRGKKDLQKVEAFVRAVREGENVMRDP